MLKYCKQGRNQDIQQGTVLDHFAVLPHDAKTISRLEVIEERRVIDFFVIGAGFKPDNSYCYFASGTGCQF